MKLRFLFPLALICLLCLAAQAQEKGRIVCIEGAGDNKTTFKIWLEKHVLYIISRKEKEVALTLKTEAEQEQFVEEFWRRRDPTPATEINEFREAYYERIAYANEHFSSAAVPGWKTDKGKVYIVYGKPDSVVTSFDEKETKSWIEEWHYTYVVEIGSALKFVFVDYKGDGDFRLAGENREFFR